jgi:hypothetical protein
MDTESLIRRLSADAARAPGPPPQTATRLASAAALGAVVALAISISGLGVRADLASSLLSLPAVLKIIAPLALAAGAFVWARGLARPDAPPFGARMLLPAAALFLAPALGAGLPALSQDVGATLGNGTAWVCLALLGLTALAPLALVLAAMRTSATTNPGWAGFAAGLLAGGVGAAAYAVHCPLDAVAFVSIWYPAAIGIVGLAGALAGRRLLRW